MTGPNYRLKMVALAILIYAISLVGAAIAPRPETQPAATANPTAARPSDRPQTHWLGFSINLHYTHRVARQLDAVNRIADLGADTVQVLCPTFQADGAADEIQIVAGPDRGPHRRDLVALLQHARQRGLKTALMPVVLFTNPRGSEWRGKISPNDGDQWWESYRRMIDYFLDVAIECDVDLFCVGSELLSTERQTARWRELIAHVRDRFDGRLIYSTNWDHYFVPAFWDDLDMIGISGYWNLTVGSDQRIPPPSHLSQRWREIQRKIFEFARHKNRPIILTEVGYPSLPWALSKPWNYVAEDDTQPDPQAQLAGYRSLLDAWTPHLHPHGPVRGMLFYEWDVYRRGGPQDTSYGVLGKPAQSLLKQWFATR